MRGAIYIARMPYRAVIFDLDGTLIDSERHNLEAWRLACRQHGYELEDAFYHSLVGLTRVRADERLREEFAGCNLEELRAARKHHFYHSWDSGALVRWKPGLEVLLDFLDSRLIPRAVATSSVRTEAVEKLARSGLTERIPVVVCGDEVAAGKPAPDIFLEAARRLGMPPAECLAVEDSPWGVQAAESAGMHVVFIPDLVPASRGMTRVLSSLAEITGLLGH